MNEKDNFHTISKTANIIVNSECGAAPGEFSHGRSGIFWLLAVLSFVFGARAWLASFETARICRKRQCSSRTVQNLQSASQNP